MLKKVSLLLLLWIAVFLPWRASIWLDVRAAERLAVDGHYAAAAERAAAAAQRYPLEASLWAQAARYWAWAGDYTAADRAFARAAEGQALRAEDWAQWGRVRWQAGDQEGALAVWQRAQEQGAATPELFRLLAQTFALRGEAEKEQQVLTAWLALDDTDAWAHYRLASWQAAALDPQALPHLRRAAELDPRLASAAEALRLALNAALTQNDALLIGRALAAQEAWPQAASAFALAVEQQPQNGAAWAWLAEARQHTGEDPSAALARALSLAPQQAEVWGLRGLYFSRRGDWETARQAWAQAAALSYQSPDWWPSLGMARAQTGDLNGALEAYRQATRLAPQEARTWYLLGQFCLEYNIALDGEGLNAALKAYLLEKDNPRYALLVGRYYLTLNNPSSARKYLQAAYELSPEDAQTALYWGIWQAQFGQPQAARAALERALQSPLEPVRWQAQYWLETLP